MSCSGRAIKKRHMKAMAGPLVKIQFEGVVAEWLNSLPNDAARHDAIRVALKKLVRRVKKRGTKELKETYLS